MVMRPGSQRREICAAMLGRPTQNHLLDNHLPDNRLSGLTMGGTFILHRRHRILPHILRRRLTISQVSSNVLQPIATHLISTIGPMNFSYGYSLDGYIQNHRPQSSGPTPLSSYPSSNSPAETPRMQSRGSSSWSGAQNTRMCGTSSMHSDVSAKLLSRFTVVIIATTNGPQTQLISCIQIYPPISPSNLQHHQVPRLSICKPAVLPQHPLRDAGLFLRILMSRPHLFSESSGVACGRFCAPDTSVPRVCKLLGSFVGTDIYLDKTAHPQYTSIYPS